MFMSAPAAIVSNAFVIGALVFSLIALKQACLPQSITATQRM